MHTADKHTSKTQTEYRPSRAGSGADPMDTVSLNGDCVRDAQGEEIGRIEGVMLDGSRDRIMYAVLSLSGSLGGDGRLFARPLERAHAEPRRCVRGIWTSPPERLKAAPGFDRDSWPSIMDRGWREEIDAYYGVRPPRK